MTDLEAIKARRASYAQWALAFEAAGCIALATTALELVTTIDQQQGTRDFGSRTARHSLARVSLVQEAHGS